MPREINRNYRRFVKKIKIRTAVVSFRAAEGIIRACIYVYVSKQFVGEYDYGGVWRKWYK